MRTTLSIDILEGTRSRTADNYRFLHGSTTAYCSLERHVWRSTSALRRRGPQGQRREQVIRVFKLRESAISRLFSGQVGVPSSTRLTSGFEIQQAQLERRRNLRHSMQLCVSTRKVS